MNKKRKERINPKTNIKNFLPRSIRLTKFFLKYKKVYFFDTNILVGSKKDTDKRIKKLFTANSNYFITSPIKKEVHDLIKSEKNKWMFRKYFKVISMENMRHQFPETCVLYYNYIQNMFNPANIVSPEFILEFFLAI